MKYKITQRYEETWICEVEADNSEQALRKFFSKGDSGQRQPQTQTVTVEQIDDERQ